MQQKHNGGRVKINENLVQCNQKYFVKTSRKFSLDDKKYITSWQWFLSCDIHTLYHREHETWHKYKRPPSYAPRHIELQTDTN